MGILRAEQILGNEVFLFEYDKSWLDSGVQSVLDPDLMLYSGPQYATEEKINFGIFLDSSPDRWGRLLMRRREAIMAKLENRSQRSLLPSDYLLGVYDAHRIGHFALKKILMVLL